MRFGFRLLMVVGLISLCWICTGGCTGEPDDERFAPRRAPLFALKDFKGKTLRLADLKGKVVLLNFFATWCRPCRQEIPDLERLYERFRDQGLEIVGISLDMAGADVVAPFVRQYGIRYPVVLGTRQTVVDYGGIKGIPTNVLIDRDGMIDDYFVGLHPAHTLEAAVRKLLKGKLAKGQDHSP